MAMVDDDMKEDSIYSLLMDTLNSNPSAEALSPEDVAWVDSCFNKDLGSYGADWSSVKDALLEIFISQSGPPSFAAAESSYQPTDNKIFHSREISESLGFGRASDEDEDLINEVGEAEEIPEDDDEDLIFGNKTGKRVTQKSQVQNVFRPNYSEDVPTVENLDSGLDLSLTAYEEEPSSEDIFKVWDLGISDEQDDFAKQLDKVLAEIPPQIPSTADDSASRKELMNVSVDDLIAGIDGLSLAQNTK